MIQALLLLLAAGPARAVSIERLPNLEFKTGHLIAISEMRADPSTIIFEAATASRYGHMGVVAETPEDLMVYHSMPPGVQKSPLADFLGKSLVADKPDPQFTLLRHAEPLSTGEQSGLIEVMEDMLARKVPFNYTVTMNPKSVNCSEFVRRAFDAIGRTGLGDLGPIGRSNFGAFDGALMRLFRIRLPPPESPGVSPASIVNSPQLEAVHAGLPVERFLSDAEIFKAWKDGGGLDKLSEMTRIPREKLEELGKNASTKPYRAYPPGWRRPKTFAPAPPSS
ncbi:MAG: hypothetical protein HY077_17180 [Elusimicrobia bacterium]|nr:hypothetical protein [Elusimicrobiota bacterium]